MATFAKSWSQKCWHTMDKGNRHSPPDIRPLTNTQGENIAQGSADTLEDFISFGIGLWFNESFYYTYNMDLRNNRQMRAAVGHYTEVNRNVNFLLLHWLPQNSPIIGCLL